MLMKNLLAFEPLMQNANNEFSRLQIVEKLVDIVIFLHKQIRDSFNEAGK